MAGESPALFHVLQRLRRPLVLTWAGLIAERVVHAFWPFWTILASVAAALILGLHDLAPVEVVWCAAMLAILGGLFFIVNGLRRFRWPRRQDAIDRLDASMVGHPLAALADRQIIGGGDAGSEALWRAHLDRMQRRAETARAVEPDLKLSRRDLFGLRYVALLGLVVALLFGSVWRAGSVTQMVSPGRTDLASGPTWEGWIEPPTYTGLPSLYLNDLSDEITVPEDSRVILRLYGEVGALTVAETVSGRTSDVGSASDPEQEFTVKAGGDLRIDGPAGANG